jgi:8-oxo-dGTP pyrophosphatase MutT (NUDIX family)
MEPPKIYLNDIYELPNAKGALNEAKWRPYMSTKVSYGIICIRLDHIGPPQVLLVRKRYTYAYSEFIYGKYPTNISKNPSAKMALMTLLSEMTIEEKMDICSLNFDQMWYRIWLNNPKSQQFYTAKNKFESTFLVDQGGRLRKLISRSKNANIAWEVPKGRKKNKQESAIVCAIREFEEETGIPKKHYKIFPDIKRKTSIIDKGTRYLNVYYGAIIRAKYEPKFDFLNQNHLDEISNIAWMNLSEVRFYVQDKVTIMAIKKYIRAIKRKVEA